MTDIFDPPLTTTLSVSSDAFSEDCREVIATLRYLKMAGNVTCNTTITTNQKTEAGCKILQTSRNDSYFLWNYLKNKFNLTCAHIDISSTENGCIYDVFGLPRCPSRKENT